MDYSYRSMQVLHQVILEDLGVDVFFVFFYLVFVFCVFPFVSGLLFVLCLTVIFFIYSKH